jgi:hypothetical protein
MINWRTTHNYLLLFAFAFKILILGTMLTLATHNICLGQLLNDDFNWSRLVCKQRKRNDDPVHYVVSINAEILQRIDRSVFPRRWLMLPVMVFLWLLSPLYASRRVLCILNSPLWYTPDKIFIRYCALVR